jgi:hypothetical protein
MVADGLGVVDLCRIPIVVARRQALLDGITNLPTPDTAVARRLGWGTRLASPPVKCGRSD